MGYRGMRILGAWGLILDENSVVNLPEWAGNSDPTRRRRVCMAATRWLCVVTIEKGEVIKAL